MSHPFGDLLSQYRARKPGLTLARLANLVGYDKAVLVRMGQGQKDLTGPSGRERVVRTLGVLRDEGVLTTQGEANALLDAAGMPPLYPGYPDEAALIQALRPHDPATFGEFFRSLRHRMQLTQQELGLALGYSAAMVARLESGELLPDLALVKTAYVEALGLQYEPELTARLIELAALARNESPARPITGPEPQPSLRRTLTNLPLPLTPFIGRERELEEVKRLIGAHRLVTLTGAGGVGKTRLAEEVGASYVEAAPPPFPDGVWLAELAPVSAPELVPGVLAGVLGLAPGTRPAREVLLDHLRGRRLLLIVDNCEHLISACVELAEALLRACPHLHILATSREALGIPAETTWRVPSLLPAQATQLFAQRARATKPDFALTAQTAPSVARVCARLDGIPLAIELAAARTRTFTVEQIEARLGDAFRLFTAGSRTALPRHRTLRALIDWSYDLLPEPERVLLRRLSVFAGGWTLEAAEAVAADAGPGLDAADVPALLDQLVGKSLVNVDEAALDAPGETRYAMLETIRQYAYEKLVQAGEHAPAHGRHLAYICALTEAVHWRLRLPWAQREAGYDRVRAELGNVRAALQWVAQTHDTSAGLRLVDNLVAFWMDWTERSDELEGLRWATAVLPDERSAGSPRAAALAHLLLARLHVARGVDWGPALEHYATALPLARQAGDAELTWWILRGLSFTTPDRPQALAYFEEWLDITPEEDRAGVAAVKEHDIGHRARLAGDLAAAARHQQVALAGYRAVGEQGMMGMVLKELSRVAVAQGDDATARGYLEQGLAIDRVQRDTLAYTELLLELSALTARQGGLTAALTMVRECLTAFYKADDLKRVSQGVAVAAQVAFRRGDGARAARLLSAADGLWQSLRMHVYYKIDYHSEVERLLPLVRAALPSAEFDSAWAEGQAMTLD
jgi:predicted ATPase